MPVRYYVYCAEEFKIWKNRGREVGGVSKEWCNTNEYVVKGFFPHLSPSTLCNVIVVVAAKSASQPIGMFILFQHKIKQYKWHLISWCGGIRNTVRKCNGTAILLADTHKYCTYNVYAFHKSLPLSKLLNQYYYKYELYTYTYGLVGK